MAIVDEPWVAPLRGYARLWESRHYRNASISDMSDKHLGSGSPVVVPWDYQENHGQGHDFTTYQEHLYAGGDVGSTTSNTATVQFSLENKGTISGPLNINRYDGFESKFTFDIICPSGFSSYQWYLDGMSQLIASRCTRYVRFAVGKLREPTSQANWTKNFDDNREFYAGQPYMMFPQNWSLEATGTMLPVSPGEWIRFFFDFRFHDWDMNDKSWDVSTSVNFGMGFFNNVQEGPVGFIRDKSDTLNPILDTPFISGEPRRRGRG